jgi:hypothetical protein
LHFNQLCRDTGYEGKSRAGESGWITRGKHRPGAGKGRGGNQVIGALETIGWVIVAAVAAWGLTLAHATSAISRLDAC